MPLTKILQGDYTLSRNYYQIKLPFDLEIMIPNNDPVRLLNACVEGMDLSELYQTYTRVPKNPATPKQLFKIVVYAAMNGIFSSRKIETACRQNINYMYLLEGREVPDNATIARFISLHLAQCSKEMMAESTWLLRRNGLITSETVFIDGTKIEANANQYTFVWKKTVTKNMAKMLAKVAGFVAECEAMYGFRVVYNDRISLKVLKRLAKQLRKICRKERVVFVYGSGKRKTPLQKSVEQAERYLQRMKDYVYRLHVCGERNSYSKTDHDATFMRMKEDAMLNGQLKPAYNLQHAVDAGYITWVSISAYTTDTRTLIPLLREMEKNLKFKYRDIVADAGYESEENYSFLEDRKMTAVIKPANYEISKTRKYRKDISRKENMPYDPEGDFYTCMNRSKLECCGTKKRKTASGYVREETVYRCNDCLGCPHKSECIKGKNWKVPEEERFKTLSVSRKFERQRKECLERIVSDEGVQLRVNRSIQAEGAFALWKEDQKFRQFLCRGQANVYAESVLMAIAQNIGNLHRRIQAGRLGHHLYEVNA
jgi:transposase